MSRKKDNKKVLFSNKFKNIFLFFVFIALFLIYLKNVSSDVYGGDVGELVTAAYFGGVPHPPGYPLFTILGYLFSHLPINLLIIQKVGLVSVLSSMGALFFFYKLVIRISKNFLISILSMLVLAFSYLFWFYTEIPEVFALNNFFAVLMFYLAVSFYQTKKIKYFYYLVFFSALSFTHHQTIILIFPSIIYLIYGRFKKIPFNKKNIIIMIFLFVFGLLPYLYIPFIGAYNKVISWDEAYTMERFINLILRRDYGTFSAGQFKALSFLARIIILKDFFTTIINSVSTLVFAISALGVYRLIKADKKIFISFFIAFLITGPVFNFYAGFPMLDIFIASTVERFYILPSVILLLYLPFGFLFIYEFITKVFNKSIYAYLVMMVFLLIPIMLYRMNVQHTNLSKVKIGENLGKDIITSLPQNALLFILADTSLFNTFYINHVLGVRPDVLVANPPAHPGDKKLLGVKEDDYSVSIEEVIKKFKGKRPIVTYVKADLSRDYTWVPKGLTLELYSQKEIPLKEEYLKEQKKIWESMTIPKREGLTLAERNPIGSSIPGFYSNALIETGNFVNFTYGDATSAAKFYAKAIKVDNENPRAYAYLGLALYSTYKDCNSAEENIKKAIFYGPNFKPNYGFLYSLYKECNKDKKVLNSLRQEYFANFNEDINNVVKKIKDEKLEL